MSRSQKGLAAHQPRELQTGSSGYQGAASLPGEPTRTQIVRATRATTVKGLAVGQKPMTHQQRYHDMWLGEGDQRTCEAQSEWGFAAPQPLFRIPQRHLLVLAMPGRRVEQASQT